MHRNTNLIFTRNCGRGEPNCNRLTMFESAQRATQPSRHPPDKYVAIWLSNHPASQPARQTSSQRQSRICQMWLYFDLIHGSPWISTGNLGLPEQSGISQIAGGCMGCARGGPTCHRLTRFEPTKQIIPARP